MARFINPKPQFANGNNQLLPGGKLTFFRTGTSIKKDTFTDPELTTPSTNPVILGADGIVPDIFLAEDEQYKVILDDKDDVQKWVADPVGGAVVGGQFSEWSGSASYETKDVVKGSDNEYYIALQDSTNQNPTTQPSFWTQIELLRVWNTAETYALNDLVLLDGVLYKSLSGSNAGNNPTTNPDVWRSYEPEILAHITSGTTVDGYGIISVSNPATGVYDLVLAATASATQARVIQVQPTGTSAITLTVTKTGTAAVTVRQWLTSGVVPSNNFPIEVTSWLVDV